MSSGEAARVKARLTQIGRYWEELRENVQQLDGQLEESSSHQQKFETSLEKVSRVIIDAVWYLGMIRTHTCDLYLSSRCKHLSVSYM